MIPVWTDSKDKGVWGWIRGVDRMSVIRVTSNEKERRKDSLVCKWLGIDRILNQLNLKERPSFFRMLGIDRILSQTPRDLSEFPNERSLNEFHWERRKKDSHPFSWLGIDRVRLEREACGNSKGEDKRAYHWLGIDRIRTKRIEGILSEFPNERPKLVQRGKETREERKFVVL